MARGEQILRHWNLLKILQTRGVGMSLAELARHLGGSDRTIQRDLKLLTQVGFPIEHDDNEFGKRFWRLPHRFVDTSPLFLGMTEAISLHLAERLLTPLAGTNLAAGLESILKKIRSLLPAQALDYFAELDETVYVRRMGVTDYQEHANTIETLTDAARSEKTIDVRYRGLWRASEYTTRFDTYGIVYYDGDLFAIGRSHRADAVRMFKVTRIAEAATTGDRFERPADFNLENQFRSSFGIFQSRGEPIEIRVKFTGAAATLVEERIWHESQQTTWQPVEQTLFEPPGDESDTLIAKYRLSGVIEFKRWIKGFGDQAEILHPADLRREMREELLAAAELHG